MVTFKKADPSPSRALFWPFRSFSLQNGLQLVWAYFQVSWGWDRNRDRKSDRERHDVDSINLKVEWRLKSAMFSKKFAPPPHLFFQNPHTYHQHVQHTHVILEIFSKSALHVWACLAWTLFEIVTLAQQWRPTPFLWHSDPRCCAFSRVIRFKKYTKNLSTWRGHVSN